MITDKDVYQQEANKPSGCGKRHTKHDDKGIKEVFEKSRHQEVADDKSQNDVPLEGPPRAGQVVCGPAQLNTVEGPKLRLEGSHDLISDCGHGGLQGNLLWGDYLNRNGALRIDVVDLGRSLFQANLSQRSQGHPFPSGGLDRQVGQLLCPLELGLICLHHQVNFITIKPIIARLGAVHEHIHGSAKVSSRHPQTTQPITVRYHPHFRIPQIQAWNGTYLSIGNELGYLTVYPSAEHDQSLYLRALDFYLNGSPFANAVSKEARLLDNGNHARDFSQHAVDVRKQLSRSFLDL